MGLLNNDWVQVSIRGKCFNQEIIATHHYLVSGDYNAVTSVAADLDDIKANITLAGANDILTSYLACLPPQYTLLELRTQRIRAVRSAFRVTSFAGIVGTNANAATVACDSGAITLRGDLAGRSKVSVKKIGPLPDGASVAGLLTAAQTALHSTWASKLITAFAPIGSGSLMVPIVPHPDLITFDILNNFLVGTESRVMTRRVVGRGK